MSSELVRHFFAYFSDTLGGHCQRGKIVNEHIRKDDRCERTYALVTDKDRLSVTTRRKEGRNHTVRRQTQHELQSTNTQHRPWNPGIVEMRIAGPATFNTATSIDIMSNKHRGIGVDERVKKQRKSNVQPRAQTPYIPDNFIRGYIHTIFSSTIPRISLTILCGGARSGVCHRSNLFNFNLRHTC
jgi:hypothetical protein